MLSDHQKATLEEAGTAIVRIRLTNYGGGRDTVVGGFKCENVTRGDLEDWLTEKSREEMAQQSSILRWAKIAGVAAIIGAAIAALGIILQK